MCFRILFITLIKRKRGREVMMRDYLLVRWQIEQQVGFDECLGVGVEVGYFFALVAGEVPGMRTLGVGLHVQRCAGAYTGLIWAGHR
jgi:hypothetical protein